MFSANISLTLLDMYHNHPHIHLFGSCFGHQIICQAILSPSPSASCVSYDPKGWELGIHAITLSSEFLSRFGPVVSNHSSNGTQLRLQFVHHDHVVVPPTGLPEGWMSIGRSEHCALQGVYQPGRILTYQGHAEFDTFINTETLRTFGPLAGWTAEMTADALKAVEGEDDAMWAATLILRFIGEQSRITSPLEGGVTLEGCASAAESELRVDDGLVKAVLQEA
jgi:GMP synthase-like glutamine amidotransferase